MSESFFDMIFPDRLKETGAPLGGAALPGYGLAFLCALTWAGYYVLSRRLGAVPTASVAVFCLATSVLSAGLHLAVEPTVWPQSATGWLACLALGIGPVGIAFYVWDIGVKAGDIQILGVASYAAPLLSTLALIAGGAAAASGGWAAAAASAQAASRGRRRGMRVILTVRVGG